MFRLRGDSLTLSSWSWFSSIDIHWLIILMKCKSIFRLRGDSLTFLCMKLIFNRHFQSPFHSLIQWFIDWFIPQIFECPPLSRHRATPINKTNYLLSCILQIDFRKKATARRFINNIITVLWTDDKMVVIHVFFFPLLCMCFGLIYVFLFLIYFLIER